MVLVNDPAETPQYRNGSFGTVVKLKKQEVRVKMDDTGNKLDIGIYQWDVCEYQAVNEDGKLKIKSEVIGCYRQIPLKLAYAVTTHKSQGQTYSRMNFHPEIFACGQLYVALSRVTSIEGLYVSRDLKTPDMKVSRGYQWFMQENGLYQNSAVPLNPVPIVKKSKSIKAYLDRIEQTLLYFQKKEQKVRVMFIPVDIADEVENYAKALMKGKKK